MAGPRVTVFGYSTEGYAAASQMAAKGADVRIIDESASSAVHLNADIAKTYPDIASLKEDDVLLSMEPIDVAISKAKYLFFAPRIRKTGQEIKAEVQLKFKDAIRPLKKGSSVVFSLPTGFGGNGENAELLQHVTGFEAGRQIRYYYYPLEAGAPPPRVIGSHGGAGDEVLAGLLATGKKTRPFAAVQASEHLHAMDIMTRLSAVCNVLEVCRYSRGDLTREDIPDDDLHDIFLDGMMGGIFDMRALAASIETSNSLLYLINSGIKGVDGYVSRLINEIRAVLKKNEMKAAKTKVAISWKIDRYAMRGDRLAVLDILMSKLRDYFGDVEAYKDPGSDIFHTDKTTIAVACSKQDYEHITRTCKGSDMLVVRANPLCESGWQ
ncbi:MAG: hypothetical protein MPI95_07330 [Nitrosopumilus sp.]|nr:hypothetical protein [Nitrosopumilus sp.]CAI9831656.1 conserved hypothetical protein [Nitrosopumilaceae archaeon]MDA7940996.1 hypothetical protein [Nitrosopumilus sp.]MDA7942606.1 hypothetical protein [Nitrosopumilus sp.]MDA7944426.1 hypothetical protein [Nitrosopumilus sp.]